MTVFGGPEVGFTMLVPEGWVTMGADDFDTEALADALGDGFDPAVIEAMETAFASGSVLFAMDPVSKSEFFDNVNVLKSPASGFTAEGIANLLAAQMEQMVNAQDVTAEVVALPAGDAARVSYRIPDLGSEGILFQIFTDDADWVVTFSSADFGAFEYDVDEMIDSFTPLP